MGRKRTTYDEQELRDLATRGGDTLVSARWRDWYHDAIRPRRVDALLGFVRYASRMARAVEEHGGGWYGDHVVWAIDRLVALGYTFPECDPIVVRSLPRLEDRRHAA